MTESEACFQNRVACFWTCLMVHSHDFAVVHHNRWWSSRMGHHRFWTAPQVIASRCGAAISSELQFRTGWDCRAHRRSTTASVLYCRWRQRWAWAVMHSRRWRRARHMMSALRNVIWTAISVVVAMWVALADAVSAVPSEASIFGAPRPMELICATFFQS